LYSNVLAQLNGALGATLQKARATLDAPAARASAFTAEEMDGLRMLAKFSPEQLQGLIARSLPAATGDEGAPIPGATAGGAPGFTDEQTKALVALAALAPQLLKMFNDAEDVQPTNDSLGDGFEARDLAAFRAAHGLGPVTGVRTADADQPMTREQQLYAYQRGEQPKVPRLPEHATLEDQLSHYQRYGHTPPDAA
jgi:hypothetical protein